MDVMILALVITHFHEVLRNYDHTTAAEYSILIGQKVLDIVL